MTSKQPAHFLLEIKICEEQMHAIYLERSSIVIVYLVGKESVASVLSC